MKFVSVAVFVAIFLAGGKNSSGTPSVSSSKLTLNGYVSVSLYSPIEDVWATLSTAHRYPIIHSGDLIVLRSAYSSYQNYLLYCSPYCQWYTCSGPYMSSSKWSSCSSYAMFTITAKDKWHGEPINSGDTVSLSSKAYGSSYRLYCSSSSSSKCYVRSLISSITGNNWLYYSYLTFVIYSRNAQDGTPVQYGDVIGLKFPYSSNSAWLSYYSSYFYPRSCSSSSKTSCARENTYTGFKIFKKL